VNRRPPSAMGRSYLKVLIAWAMVLTILYFFQEYFS
jgi:hypothetical protein